jgi:hypothetical protein
MKTTVKSTGKNLNEFVSMLSENEKLNFQQMLKTRGGDPDGNGGGSPIVVTPPKP